MKKFYWVALFIVAVLTVIVQIIAWIKFSGG